MANHAEELGKHLLAQQGSLTTGICKDAVEAAAAAIREDQAKAELKSLGYWLVLNGHRGSESCLHKIRETALKVRKILRPSSNGTPQNSDPPKAT